MKRINDRTVELEPDEMKAWEYNQHYLDKGHDVPLSAKLALNRRLGDLGREASYIDDEFINYLSDGTCERWGRRVRVKKEWRESLTSPKQ